MVESNEHRPGCLTRTSAVSWGDSLIDNRNSLRLYIKAVMNLFWRDAEDTQILPNQAACSIAIKWGCSVIRQFCRLLQCFAYPWLGCCMCTFTFIFPLCLGCDFAVLIHLWDLPGWVPPCTAVWGQLFKMQSISYRGHPMDPNVYSILGLFSEAIHIFAPTSFTRTCKRVLWK